MDWLTSPDSAFWLWVDRAAVALSFVVLGTVIKFFLDLRAARQRKRQFASSIAEPLPVPPNPDPAAP